MDERQLAQLLDDVAAGRMSVREPVDALRSLPIEDVAGAKNNGFDAARVDDRIGRGGRP